MCGQIVDTQCSIYGDYNSKYHNGSLKRSNLVWDIGRIAGHEAEFVKMAKSLTIIENSVSSTFSMNATSKHRVNKGNNDIHLGDAFLRLKCKLARKASSLSTNIVPKDRNEEQLWKDTSKEGFFANSIPNGVFDKDGKLVQFEEYSKYLTVGAQLAVSARIQSVNYQNKYFVQLILTKIQVLEPAEEAEVIPEDVSF